MWLLNTCGAPVTGGAGSRCRSGHRWPRPRRAKTTRSVWLGLFDGTNLPTSVIPAVRTDLVGWFPLVALRADPRRDGDETVVGSPLRRTRFRVPSFRIRHNSFCPLASSRRLAPVGTDCPSRQRPMSPRQQILQPCQSGILPRVRAVARRGTSVRTAERAQAWTLFPAERLHRERELQLFPY